MSATSVPDAFSVPSPQLIATVYGASSGPTSVKLPLTVMLPASSIVPLSTENPVSTGGWLTTVTALVTGSDTAPPSSVALALTA